MAEPSQKLEQASLKLNANRRCTGTTKVGVKVTGRNAWRGKPWGDLRKQT